jgi:SNF2 family DNA or RNA helicase
MLKQSSPINLTSRYQGHAYQLQAVEAVKELTYAALFHEQGLGKTKIGLDLALEWIRKDVVDCVLVVTKRSLVQNWQDEIASHTHLRARVIGQEKKDNFFALNSAARLYVTHYEATKTEERRLALFLRTRRVAVILDEAQKIKNPDSEISQVLHRLGPGFVRRVIMTGTPVANRPFDIWSQIFFLDSGDSLGRDFEAFRASLDLTNDLWSDSKKQIQFEAELGLIFDKIRSFTVRETKATAGLYLPDKTISNVTVELEATQEILYKKFQSELGAQVVRDGLVVQDGAEDILKRLLRLVQVASNPLLVDDSYMAIPGKVPVLKRIVEDALAAGSKIIIWTTFIQNAEWLCQMFRESGSVVVHGALGIDTRNSALESFKHDPSTRILVATPGAAKEGLTLTVANHAVFYDRSFSLDDYLQAQDRIHRISQTQPCYIWNLIASNSVDEWVDSLLNAKRLAAQLAQADISVAEYGHLANYDFGLLVKQILGIEGEL